ncbi:unnamed protein product [Diamesa serratosioi]
MPAYYDMLVSQSPPLFSHSPPSGFLSEYASTRCYESPRLCRFGSVQTQNSRRFPPQQQSLYQTHLQSLTPYKMPSITPKRSCLIVRPMDYKYSIFLENDKENGIESDDNDDRCIQPRSKRRVVFADAKGLELEHIKIMAEASTQPPTWSLQFLAHVTQGMISVVPQEQWTIDFRQPASDYLEFRRKLETKFVSLENVIIKESEFVAVGTIKVKNISFQKEVFIRASWDEWKSQVDTYCTYIQNVVSSGAYVVYDTFSFKLTLPPSSQLQFCVCFKTDGNEYWDNNQGINYILTNRITPKYQENECLKKLNRPNQQENEYNNQTNPIQIKNPKFESWSDSSSRNSSPLPYW